jgi:hypothetical protein
MLSKQNIFLPYTQRYSFSVRFCLILTKKNRVKRQIFYEVEFLCANENTSDLSHRFHTFGEAGDSKRYLEIALSVKSSRVPSCRMVLKNHYVIISVISGFFTA